MNTLNLTKMLTRQGLDPSKSYHAKVVDNNDPRKIGRIRARIAGVHEGLKDDELPWAVPKFEHCHGAFNDGATNVKRCGNFYVPRKGSKVVLQFPQKGDPHHAVYSGYTVDDMTMMPEAKTNYPDRAVVRFDNGMFIIVDTKTNELFINNPGDMHMTILGSVNQYIVGNQMVKVTDSMGDISPYLASAPDKILDGLKPNPYGKIQFEGLLAKSKAGNQHTHIKGDQTLLIEGNRQTVILGHDVQLTTKSSSNIGSQIFHRIVAGKIEFN